MAGEGTALQHAKIVEPDVAFLRAGDHAVAVEAHLHDRMVALEALDLLGTAHVLREVNAQRARERKRDTYTRLRHIGE